MPPIGHLAPVYSALWYSHSAVTSNCIALAGLVARFAYIPKTNDKAHPLRTECNRGARHLLWPHSVPVHGPLTSGLTNTPPDHPERLKSKERGPNGELLITFSCRSIPLVPNSLASATRVGGISIPWETPPDPLYAKGRRYGRMALADLVGYPYPHPQDHRKPHPTISTD